MSSITGPRQTILVSTRLDNKDNLIALAWHMPVSFKPFLYAIAVGKSRFSADLIKRSKVFCVNFVPFKMKDEVLICGRKTGQNIDKFKEANLRKEECSNIDCPRLRDCLGFLECQLANTIDAGDHYIFVGEVINQKEFSSEKRLYHLGEDKFTTTLV